MEKQRLFRLTSTSNDGKFTTTFNEDIKIPANSEIALQSLSFDRSSDELVVPAVEKKIGFAINQTTDLAITAKKFTCDVPRKADNTPWKSNTDGLDFLKALGKEMNIQMGVPLAADKGMPDAAGFVYQMSQGSQWDAYLDDDDFVNVQCKVQPPARPAQGLWKTLMTQPNVMNYKGAEVFAPGSGSEPPTFDQDYLFRTTGGAGAGDDYNDAHVYSGVRMCKGAAGIQMRIRENAGTGTLVTAVVGLTNSAGVAAFEAGNFTIDNILFAVRSGSATSTYEFKQGAGAFQPVGGAAGLVPAQVSGDFGANGNDVISINIGGAVGNDRLVNMGVHQAIGKTVAGVVGAAQFVSQDEDLHFFVALAQDGDAIKIDMLEVDLDPYKYNPEIAESNFSQRSTLTPGTASQVVRNGYERINLTDPLIPIPLSRRIGILDLPNEVADFLGYDVLTADYLNDIAPKSQLESTSYLWVADKRSEFAVRSKTYMVLFNNVPLDSYDSFARHDVDQRRANTGGARQNILATVPAKEDLVTGTSVTQLAYEPSTLNYISMSNRSPLVTRSLRCEVLTAVYGKVSVNGLASMTLLVRDKKD